MILAAMTLLSMSLNAQFDATKKVAQTQQTAPTGKKVDMQLGVAKMALNPTSHRAPARATETTTVTFTAGTDVASAKTITKDGVTITNTQTQTNNNSFGYNPYRFYPSTLTISTESGNITNIVITGNSTTNYPISRISGTGYSYSGRTGTWNGTAAPSVNLSVSNQARANSIVVTVETETGGETSDLTVCDGQYYAQYLPVFGYYHDEAQHNQMIYPASMLASMIGKTIKSMTFYPTSGSVTWSGGETESASGINFRNGSVCFKLACISSGSSFDADNPSFVNATLTEVKTVNMPSTANTSATTWLIRFDQDFVYTGGDLLIDVTNPTTGDWGLTFFTVDDTGDNYYGYLTSGAGNAALNYLPKVTFTYEGEPNPVHDLAIALDAQPASVGPGSTVTLTATVTNNGNQPENGYTVTFTANGSTINTQTATSELPVGQSTTFTYTYTTTDAQAGTTVNFGANVTCTDDADASNNEATASTSVLTCPPPENVAATATGNTGTMTWDAPTIAPVPGTLTWDFEEESDINDFTRIDSDNDGHNWGWHYNTGSGNYTANSGLGVAYSESYSNDYGAYTPDNWLISPQIALGGTLTFYAANQSTYPENFAVYVCEGPYSDVSSFTKIYGDITTSGTMTQHTIDLSAYEGQGYFAIRHYNVTDQFILLIDDIECQTTVPGEQPSSYNIYLDGQFVTNVDANTFSYTFNNVSDGEHECAVSAVYSYGESAAVPATFTTQPKTEAPSISYETVGDNVVITATGNGTVTLTIPGYPEASGTGSASITVPRHMQDYTVTATATAQEADHLASDPTTQEVPIPGLINDGGWMLMEGTYTNGSDQLSFTHLNSDNVVEPILFVDQFNQSTMDNRHPNEYLYKVSEKVSDDIQDARETSEVPVHVHKTYSKLNAIYTEAEVLADEYGSANELRPNVINGTMSYDINAESDIYFYGLYRGNRGEEKPGAVDDLETNTYRISKIQKDLNEDFFNENMLTNAVVPKYNHIEAGDVERIDKEYVDGVMTQEQSANNFLAYVPVIWSYGDHTGRPVGNNSYGSDIKVTHLGNVSATVGGFKSDGSATGEWEYNGTTYCVYTPIIDIYGIMPENNELAPDGDAHAYEPYMYRVWCLYEGARNFKHAPNDNGHMSLADDGELHAPFLIGEVRKTDDQAVSDHEVIGAALEHMDDQAQWSFGAPAEEGTEDEMEFIIRFYYKKTVTDAPHYTDGGDNGGAKGLREGDETNRQFYVVETSGTGKDIQTAINEMFMNGEVVSRTYVNAQGMQSDVPFDGLNIVITRYSDGTTSTTKVVR